MEKLGVRCFQGDLADYEAVRRACENCQVVFHVAAKAGVWGSFDSYHRVNVVGTENVIRACRELGIDRLIYTSSPSVTFDGTDQDGIDESAPYPQSFLAAYPATKALAEQSVLAANGPELATVSLRPHLIWGPGDQHLLPRLLQRARKGRLRFVGGGQKRVDAVYIDNAVIAHLCALERLKPGAPIAGKPYFITNAEPWPIDDIINGMLEAAAVPPVSRHISLGLALRLAGFFEYIYTWLRLRGEPPLTRFTALQLGTSHWYKTRAAQEELGYRPRISMREGMKLLGASLSKAKSEKL